MTCAISIAEPAQADLAAYAVFERILILAAIRGRLGHHSFQETIAHQPFSPPFQDWWVLQAGPYRVMYGVDTTMQRLTIRAIGHTCQSCRMIPLAEAEAQGIAGRVLRVTEGASDLATILSVPQREPVFLVNAEGYGVRWADTEDLAREVAGLHKDQRFQTFVVDRAQATYGLTLEEMERSVAREVLMQKPA